MSAYSPLLQPGTPVPTYSLGLSLGAARLTLADQQGANIYDAQAMVHAAVTLAIALRDLVASLDAEGSE
ncbi:hypothetical protein WKI68_36880 [Streptomyces sp. MS1.HAVA.3]|uniref:DUF3077 domain-containing protein n=1 Tax=Streptomyces caledonius TaxID=3134107 RepID=A0ABU8UBK5_9ACTN